MACLEDLGGTPRLLWNGSHHLGGAPDDATRDVEDAATGRLRWVVGAGEFAACREELIDVLFGLRSDLLRPSGSSCQGRSADLGEVLPTPFEWRSGPPSAQPPNDTLGGFPSLRGSKEIDESVLSTRPLLSLF